LTPSDTNPGTNLASAPQHIKTIAYLQIASGLFNVVPGVFLGGVLLSTVGGCVSTVLTLGFCPIGGFCGFASVLLLPIGAIELIAGILTLTSPEQIRPHARIVPFIQIPSLLFGGILSPIVGGVSMMLMRDPETAAYLDGDPVRDKSLDG